MRARAISCSRRTLIKRTLYPPCLRSVNSGMQKAGATQLSWLLAPEESFTKAGGMTLAGPAERLVSKHL